MHALLFPGQGVQRKGMGADLFAQFKDTTEAADEILGYSIEELCLNDARRLRDTRYAQPAIFFVNALQWQRRTNEQPGRYSYYAGHSLGEYNALVAGGYLELYDALALVAKRGEVMAQITGGGMAAVIGAPWQMIQRALDEAGLTEVFIANRNADTQSTIAGSRAQLSLATRELTKVGGVRVVPINVSGPFHTPLMEPASALLAQVLRNHSFKPGHTPVVSSVTGTVFDHERATELLSRQVAGPVEWTAAVRTLRSSGVTNFDEVNGTTLLSLIERIG